MARGSELDGLEDVLMLGCDCTPRRDAAPMDGYAGLFMVSFLLRCKATVSGFALQMAD